MKKECKRCNIIKEVNNYSVSKGAKDGLNSWCKSCQSEYKKIRKINLVKIDIDLKICNKCTLEKDISYFSKGSGKDGFNTWCKDCNNEYGRNYYINNKEDLKSVRKEWKLNNREHLREYYRERYINNDKERLSEYYINNKLDINNKKKEYQKSDEYKKWLSEYKSKNVIRFRYRNTLKGVLRRIKQEKNGKTNEILNYSDIDFKLHIENQFIGDMNWYNKNSFSIDHIIPIVAFKENTPVSIINSLSNLKPMLQYENMKKFTSIDYDYISLYIEYINYLNDDYRSNIYKYLSVN